jgi:hypothetical protein
LHLITLCSYVPLSSCDIHNGVSGELIYGLFSTFVVNRLKDILCDIDAREDIFSDG